MTATRRPGSTTPTRHRPGTATLRTAGGAAVTALVLGLLGAAPATAEPYPSQESVDSAKAAVSTTAQQVAALENRLAAANATLSQTQIAAAQAGEDWNEAQVALQEATAAAAAAKAAAARAREDLTAARAQIGSLAADAYRRGGSSLGGIEAVLGAGGPQDLVDRAGTLRYLGNGRQQVYQRGQAAELVSQLMDEQARTAEQVQQDAAAKAEQAKQAADRANAAAAAQVSATQAEKATVTAQLAALRRTSVALEQQRQAGLEAERVARAEAAARAAQERRERAARDAASRAARERAAREAADRASRDDDRDDPPASSPSPAPAPPSSPPSSGGSNGSSSGGRAAVEWARTQIGKPYEWGATGPDSYDCSGLTGAAWRHGGVSLPRTSRSQYTAVEKIGYSDLRVGDLIFYGTSDSAGSIYHVAIYSGGGMMVEAPRAGLPVRETSLRMSGAMPFAGRP